MKRLKKELTQSLGFRLWIVHEVHKSKTIKDVYSVLKHLHERDIFLGDIHLDNFLISPDESGYLIDSKTIYKEITLPLNDKSIFNYFKNLMNGESVKIKEKKREKNN